MKSKCIFLAMALLVFCFGCSSKNKGESGQAATEVEKGEPSKASPASETAPQENLNEALCNAAFSGDIAEVPRLLKAGADVNAKDSMGHTALMRASQKGNVEIVRALIQAGADFRAKREGGMTALMDASANNQPEVLKVLIEAGADPNARTEDGTGVMFWAAGYGYTEVVRELVKAGARIEDPIDQFGTTPLMHAVRNGKAETVQALLDLGAQVNAKDTSGKTALARAREEGNSEVIEILVKAGGKE